MQFDQLLRSQGLGLVQKWLGRARRLPEPVEWASGSQVTSVPEPTHILVLTGLRGRSSWRRQPPSLGSLFLAFFFGRFFSWPQVCHILQSAFIFLSTLFPQGNILMFVLQNTWNTDSDSCVPWSRTRLSTHEGGVVEELLLFLALEDVSLLRMMFLVFSRIITFVGKHIFL